MDMIVRYFNPFTFFLLIAVCVGVFAFVVAIYAEISEWLASRRYRKYGGKTYSEAWRTTIKRGRRW